MRPVDAQFPVSQEFGSDATLGVIGDPNGTEVQQLVAAYGNYQPYGHAGQDIACPIGTPVHAIADGVVIWADWGTNLPGDDTDAGYRQRWYMYKNFPGIVTLIQHDGWISMYGHLSSNDAAPVGTVVKEGQLIALSGNTKAPGVTLGAHLHVGALVDLSFSCENGFIYGCTNPEPYYGAGTIQTESTTPTTGSLFMSLTPDQEQRILAAADRINGRVDDVRVLNANDGAYMNAQRDAQHTETMAAIGKLLDKADGGYIVGLLNALPAAVLNQGFALPDGTTTNLAGLLTQIHATPATVTNVTGAALDVDALVARLKAELPAAVLARLTAKLTQP